MSSSPAGQFVGAFLILAGFALVVVSMITPPDPLTLVVWLVPAVLAAAVLAYLLAYKGGLERLQDRL
ncbi:DUF7534 family protein [Natrarchaeobius chitinivorans]|uniref:Uncharacterized protein n=1 Tax=Natrarchaeobius chitinivorans TaxID=1679083 RepID=A0A3N6NB36_NATCH|nr:hypothetical protein [Natrarchaeobius chitinivorans]RQG95822.1 hypothetical protein EA473_06435 [Natrarchaeobius chitinivorans]